jgi:hypothetical protein
MYACPGCLRIADCCPWGLFVVQLVQHLRAQGESNAQLVKAGALHRDQALAAAAAYQGLFGATEEEGGGVPATYQVGACYPWLQDEHVCTACNACVHCMLCFAWAPDPPMLQSTPLATIPAQHPYPSFASPVATTHTMVSKPDHFSRMRCAIGPC